MVPVTLKTSTLILNGTLLCLLEYFALLFTSPSDIVLKI